MDRIQAIANLRDICVVLPDAFLSNGSLLGAVREKNIIEHDRDTDLGLFIENWNPLIIEKLQKQGFELDHVFGEVDNGLEYAFKRYDIKTDIFFYYPEKDGCWHAVYRGEEQRRYHFPRPYGFTTVVMGGWQFKAPNNMREFLEAQYGADWVTPQKDWSYWDSPHNINEQKVLG